MEQNLESGEADAYLESESKRQKTYEDKVILIKELNSYENANVFYGHVVTIYISVLDKQTNTRRMRADLTDCEGEMTITLNIPDNLIEVHQDKLQPEKGVCLTNFEIRPKTPYDHGDSDCILLLNQSSSVEIMSPVCKQFNFIPNTSIKNLSASIDKFPVGTIAAIVTSAKRQGMQYFLDIKDGNTDNDKAKLQLYQSFEPYFASIEQKLDRKECPFVLFKNILKGKDGQERIFRTCKSTYITDLHMKEAIDDLKTLIQSTSKVQGTLTISNAYSIPFELVCANCNLAIESYGTVQQRTVYCKKCNQYCSYNYFHRLNCTLRTTENTSLQCILNKKNTIDKVFPQLTQMSREHYLQHYSEIIYFFRNFTVEGCFTLNDGNVIEDVY